MLFSSHCVPDAGICAGDTKVSKNYDALPCAPFQGGEGKEQKCLTLWGGGAGVWPWQVTRCLVGAQKMHASQACPPPPQPGSERRSAQSALLGPPQWKGCRERKCTFPRTAAHGPACPSASPGDQTGGTSAHVPWPALPTEAKVQR